MAYPGYLIPKRDRKMRNHGITLSVTRICVCLTLGSVLCIARPTFAAPIGVDNFSFEFPATATFDGGVPDDWSGSGGFVEDLTSIGFAEVSPTEGTQAGGANDAFWFQDTGVAWLPNSTYEFRLAAGNRSGGAESDNLLFGLSNAAAPTDGAPGFVGSPTAVDIQSSVADGTFGDFLYSFTTGAVAPSGNVVVVIDNDPSSDTRAYVDNVRVSVTALSTATVPEPSTLFLATIGLVGLVGTRRRKR